MFTRLAVLSIALFTFYCFGQLEIICYDVGQGNCILIIFNDIEVQAPPLLIDCGSKSFLSFRDDGFMINQINAISKKIAEYLLDRDDKKIFMVVSHPDEDHYLWIKDVIEATRQLNADCYVSQIKLGGQKNYIAITLIASLTA